MIDAGRFGRGALHLKTPHGLASRGVHVGREIRWTAECQIVSDLHRYVSQQRVVRRLKPILEAVQRSCG